MKPLQLLLLAFMIFISYAPTLTAQDGFASFEVLNRVLLLKYADSIDQAAKLEIHTLYKGLRKKIDGMEWVHITEVTNSSEGYDTAITLTFTSKAGLEFYESHSDYRRIQEINSNTIVQFSSYDYWEKMD